MLGGPPFEHGETVVVVHPGGRNNVGDPVGATEHSIEGVVIYPASLEESINGTVLDADEIMLGPYGITVAAEDTIYRATDTDRAHPFYAKGDAWNVKHPMTGWEAGSRVLLTYRRGGTS
jgi:hypothetical protein